MNDWAFSTPGWVDDDLPTWIKREWHQWHACRAAENLDELRAMVPGTDPTSIPYVNPVTGDLSETRSTIPVEWEGFPARVTTAHPDRDEALRAAVDKGYEDIRGEAPRGARWAFVDSDGKEVDGRVRHRQDEYLEWEAQFDGDVLRSITFVAEGYDYWQFLFERDPDRVADAYGVRTGRAGVTPDDLRAADDLDLVLVPLDGGRPQLVAERVVRRGELNQRNQLNQGPGIVHLSHRANSLGAEINLAVTSSLPRIDAAGEVVIAQPVQKLMCCTGGGDPNRSSDPRIAAAAYGQVIDKDDPKFFTLTDPIGLYIRSFKHSALQDPKGDPAPYEFWQILRGKDATDRSDRSDSRILRLHLEVPASEGYTLGEMKIDGVDISHPSEIAELVDMHLLVDAWAAPKQAPRAACKGTCCERSDGLLVPKENPKQCAEDGLVDAFPGLLATQAATRPTMAALAGRR
jgi:hypothetical protein